MVWAFFLFELRVFWWFNFLLRACFFLRKMSARVVLELLFLFVVFSRHINTKNRGITFKLKIHFPRFFVVWWQNFWFFFLSFFLYFFFPFSLSYLDFVQNRFLGLLKSQDFLWIFLFFKIWLFFWFERFFLFEIRIFIYGGVTFLVLFRGWNPGNRNRADLALFVCIISEISLFPLISPKLLRKQFRFFRQKSTFPTV